MKITAPYPAPTAPRTAMPKVSLNNFRNIGPAFWTVTSLISIFINLLLFIVVIMLGSQIFSIKRIVSDQLIGGLYNNFMQMDQAHIRTTIPVKASVPAKFNLPLKTETVVRLTKDTFIPGARVSLYGGVVTINSAPTDIILPAGSELPVFLDLNVPVNQKIPVELTVDVDIPMNETELHAPFVGLQQVVQPYYTILNSLPGSWAEVICGKPTNDFCSSMFP